MCNFVIDIDEVEKGWGLSFGEYFREDLELLAPHVDEGLVTIDERAIRATSIGELFVRNLAMCFDRYMREKHANESKPVFSRTV